MKEKKRDCKQMVEVQTRKRMNKIGRVGGGRRERRGIIHCRNLGIQPARVKGEKKCLHCCFHYLAAVILQALYL